MSEHIITHNAETHRFEVHESGHTAYLQYYQLPDGVVDFAETETPLEIRGRGIATAIIKGALEWARSQGYRIVPGCPFVATYVNRHTEYSDLLASRASKR